MERERRFVPMAEARVALREEEGGKRFLDGLGIVFNSWSEDLGGFIERILPEAVEGVIEASDIRGAFNHNPSAILGRVPKTMALRTTAEGVEYSIDLPDTAAGRDVAVSVARGDVDGSSFQFTVAEEGDRWEQTEGGILRRTIHRFAQIFEMGPVAFPAYAATVVSARSLERARAEFGAPDIAHIHAARRRALELALAEGS